MGAEDVHRDGSFEQASTRARPPSPPPRRAAIAEVLPGGRDFSDRRDEWRRLVGELVGTFFLVFVAAGGGVIAAASNGAVGRAAAVVAPGLMVMAVILGTGAVSGAHLNPLVSVAFSMRHEFPWRRVPAYVMVQLTGGVLACLLLWAMFGKVGGLGATLPGPHTSGLAAMAMEAVLTCGLVTTILGTASGAQNVGALSAIAVGGYIALAGLFSSPVSGASMNPVRSLAPDLLAGHLGTYWIYIVGPTLGMLAAVAIAFALRGPGRDEAAAYAAQGRLGTLLIDGHPQARRPSAPEATREPRQGRAAGPRARDV